MYRSLSILAICVLANAVFFGAMTVKADFPTHEILVDLGPGNETITRSLNDEIQTKLSQGSSNFNGLGIDTPINLRGRDLREAVIHLGLHFVHDAAFDRNKKGPPRF
ncbi:hypothetical protein CA13_66710 [Planctomycetes bacterium CA13]|uniref:Uncharacterized protein n=1 Tax=Novipirellula herctigrandis TaxID=2527986 RepID=A0A5C5YMW9_9BACT|nr:hypothetical protein CA13_66710 [Planctomycetes bacterium CA13]